LSIEHDETSGEMGTAVHVLMVRQVQILAQYSQVYLPYDTRYTPHVSYGLERQNKISIWIIPHHTFLGHTYAIWKFAYGLERALAMLYGIGCVRCETAGSANEGRSIPSTVLCSYMGTIAGFGKRSIGRGFSRDFGSGFVIVCLQV
jgi:hypothetical protein